MTKLGAHCSTKGNTQANIDTANALRAECFLWIAGNHRPNDAMLWPSATHIVRLPNPAVGEATEAYAHRVEQTMEEWTNRGLSDLWFQIGNEPDIPGYDLNPPWGVDLWKQVAGQYVAQVRHLFPNIRILSTPFTVAGSPGIDAAYAAPFDGIAVHSYWGADAPDYMNRSDFGASHNYAQGLGKPIYITECNSNPTDPHQIATWFQGLVGIEGVCIFLADSGVDFPQYNLSPLDAGVIRSLVDAPPSPEPVGVIISGPPPAITPEPVMSYVPVPPYKRADYGFLPLSWPQYEAIITTGVIPGRTSPMLDYADYSALIEVMKEADIDPRLALAFTWSEGHQGSDPGLVAAPYHNLGGIKYAGLPGEYDTGVGADTGGTYAGFQDLTPYYHEWVRIMNNSIIGPSFVAGNLIGAVEHYTNGPGTGHNKVDQWINYRRDYPASMEDDMALPVDGKADDGIHADAWQRTGIPLNADSAFYQKWLALVKAGVPIGVPYTPEFAASDNRTIQHYSSGASMTYVDGQVFVN